MNLLMTALSGLASHWRRHPSQLATIVTGLAVATALWSGVQAINGHARASYDRAAAIFGGERTAALVPTAGVTLAQKSYVALRRAGWRVSPLVEGSVRIGGVAYQLVGVDPLTLPKAAPLGLGAGEGKRLPLAAFIAPPGTMLVARETLADLGALEGATITTDRGRALPQISVEPGLAPGVLVVDVGIAQAVLGLEGRLTRLLLDRDGKPPDGDLATAGLSEVAASDVSDLGRLTDSFHLNLTAFSLLAFVVGLFIAHAAVGLAFEQRLATMRTMRALGLPARALAAALLVELGGIALVAGAIGVVGGYAIAAVLLPDVSASLAGLYGARVAGALTLDPGWWASGLGMALGGALVAAAASLKRALALPLLASAQPSAWLEAQRRWLVRQGAVAAALLAVALLLLVAVDGLLAGFAMLATLMLGAALALPLIVGALLLAAQRAARGPLSAWFWADTRQQLSGLSLALMALLLALAANIGVGTMVDGFRKTFTSWLDRRLVSEVYFDAKDTARAEAIEAWLGKRAEVSAVLPVWKAETRIGGWPLDVFGSRDHATYRENWVLIAGMPDAWDRVRTGKAAVVSEQTARHLGLDVGSKLAIPAAERDWTVTVAGIYADYGNPKGQARVDVAALVQNMANVQRTSFALRVAPERAADLIAAMQAEFPGAFTRLVDQRYLKQISTSIFERTFAVTAALNTLTLIVAGIALLTSLLALTGMRITQIAPVWAVGVTRRTLIWLEVAKIVMLALFTALVAVPLGIAVAWCLVAVVNVKAFGWRLQLELFPMQWLALVGLGVLAALIAAISPTLRLARTSPGELVRVFASER